VKLEDQLPPPSPQLSPLHATNTPRSAWRHSDNGHSKGGFRQEQPSHYEQHHECHAYGLAAQVSCAHTAPPFVHTCAWRGAHTHTLAQTDSDTLITSKSRHPLAPPPSHYDRTTLAFEQQGVTPPPAPLAPPAPPAPPGPPSPLAHTLYFPDATHGFAPAAPAAMTYRGLPAPANHSRAPLILPPDAELALALDDGTQSVASSAPTARRSRFGDVSDKPPRSRFGDAAPPPPTRCPPPPARRRS